MNKSFLPSAMSITPAAAARVRELLESRQSAEAGLRLGIEKGGCAGMSYKMELVDAPGAGDDVIEQDGARVFLDPSAVLFLLGTEMDYQVDKLAAQFVFRNPNEVSACGCGESVNLVEAKR
ncbi:MAG: Fe-S cluster assembly scaffold SufA [Flavobacteriaceae bacterium]